MNTYSVTGLPDVTMRERYLINDVDTIKLISDICKELDTWFIDTSAFEIAKLIDQFYINAIKKDRTAIIEAISRDLNYDFSDLINQLEIPVSTK